MKFNELKILLALNGNQRLPHLEEEIFANEELLYYYVISISAATTIYNSTDDVTIAEHIYIYAKHGIKGRWPEAEHIIATCPQCSCWYAITIVKCRWLEAEKVISKSWYYWKEYCEHFGIKNESKRINNPANS